MPSPHTSAAHDATAGTQPLIRSYRADDGASLRDCIAELQDAERAIDGRLRPGRAIASDYLDAMLEEWSGSLRWSEARSRHSDVHGIVRSGR